MQAGWTALVAGGTGLVGGHLLDRLTGAPDAGRVISLTRRPGGRSHPKLLEIPADFAEPALPPGSRPDAAFCALGTTIAKAGSEAAFRAVDHDAVLAFARTARSAGVETFVVVSSVDADPGARNFYLRTKGEMERDLAAIGFPRLHILRPSLLLGARGELRPGERVGMWVLPLLSPLLRGGLSRYRAVPAATVAAAMLGAARTGGAGVQVHGHAGILALAGQAGTLSQ